MVDQPRSKSCVPDGSVVAACYSMNNQFLVPNVVLAGITACMANTREVNSGVELTSSRSEV